VALGALSGFFALERRAQNDGKGEAGAKDKNKQKLEADPPLREGWQTRKASATADPYGM